MTKETQTFAATKLNLSIKEMCERLQLSRSRVEQLIEAGVLVAPSRDQRSGRPYFPPEAVQKNLDVRRTGVGTNGDPVLFYTPRMKPAVPVRRTTVARAERRPSQYAELLADLGYLDLGPVSEQEVARAVLALADAGNAAPDTRCVYRQIKNARSAGS